MGLSDQCGVGGRIDHNQLRDFAWFLPTDRERNKLGGGHDQRMRKKDTQADEREMKRILADWFHFGTMPEMRAEALEVLINFFKENNKPLGRDLEKIRMDENNHQLTVSLGKSAEDRDNDMEVAEQQDEPKPLTNITMREKSGTKQKDYSIGLDLSKTSNVPQRETLVQAAKNNLAKVAKPFSKAAKTAEVIWRGRFMSEREMSEKLERQNKELIETTQRLERSLSLQSTSSSKQKVSALTFCRV